MQQITELRRMPAPAPRPQAIAFDGEALWIGSIETEHLYAITPATWSVRDEGAAPGKPWGMTVTGDDLRVLCGLPPNDDRYVFRFIPGHGFKQTDRFVCPDETGSHLSWDGTRLYVSQWYNKRILSVDGAGAIVAIVDLPHEVVGHTYVDGSFYSITTDDEHSGLYYFTRIDLRDGKPKIDDIAEVHFDARGLAYDGERFWTNHREHNEIVAFAPPL